MDIGLACYFDLEEYQLGWCSVQALQYTYVNDVSHGIKNVSGQYLDVNFDLGIVKGNKFPQ